MARDVRRGVLRDGGGLEGSGGAASQDRSAGGPYSLGKQRQHRLIYSSISTSYWVCASERALRLSVGFSLGAGGVLGPGLTLGMLGGDTPSCRGGLGEQLVDTRHLVVRAEVGRQAPGRPRSRFEV